MAYKHYSLYEAGEAKIVLAGQDDFEMMFNDYPAAIAYILENFDGVFNIACHDFGMAVMITKANAEEISREYSAEYGVYDPDCLRLWGEHVPQEPEGEQEDIQCYTCRDGGCIQCDPDAFIDGFKRELWER